MTAPKRPEQTPAPALRRTALFCLAGTTAMLGLAYASVPLYNLFCRVTGFDGTPLVGSGPSARVVDHVVAVRFDANVAPGLNWTFAPEATRVEARLGETKTVFFHVRNVGAAPSTGIASFNVQPGLAGPYFVKIECFCFKEQTLQAGEGMDFPVVFYLEPGLVQDPNVKDLAEITLSYTYFASKTGKSAAAVPGPAPIGATRSNL